MTLTPMFDFEDRLTPPTPLPLAENPSEMPYPAPTTDVAALGEETVEVVSMPDPDVEAVLDSMVDSVSDSVDPASVDAALTLSMAGLSHRGLQRPDNQDTFWVDKRHIFALVADGMGGHEGGATASRLAAENMRRVLEMADGALPDDRAEDLMNEAFDEALEAVRKTAETNSNLAEMGTTLTCMALTREQELLVGHMGDSRLYRLRTGKLLPLTDDHNVLSELLRAGILTEEQRESTKRLSHLLTRVLCRASTARPDTHRIIPRTGDRYLLCSDGLHGVVE